MNTIGKVAVVAAGLTILAASGAYAGSDWLKGSTKQQLKTLAGIQPGLGTVMIEYSNRFTNAYYAAKGGNWDLAAYQIKEALEIQEVGEATRPGRAGALKAFEKAFVGKLDDAIKAKDFEKFDTAFKSTVNGCNGCHASQGFAYITYELPGSPPAPLKFSK